MAIRNGFTMTAFIMLAPFMLSLLVDSGEAYFLGPRSECDWVCKGLDLVFANRDEGLTVSGSAVGEKYNPDSVVAPMYSEQERAIFVAVTVAIIIAIAIICITLLAILCCCCMCCCGRNRRHSQPQMNFGPAGAP